MKPGPVFVVNVPRIRHWQYGWTHTDFDAEVFARRTPSSTRVAPLCNDAEEEGVTACRVVGEVD
jgi:hypothetical protein